MEQLTGMDDFHLLEETPSQLMHTLKVAIIEPTEAARAITLEDAREWVARRFLSVTPLRRRLATVPFGIARPFWAEVGQLDLDYHVQHATVAAPGGDAELDEIVGRIASTPLDRGAPLWQVWFVDGLASGRVALVLKLHHSIADGFASVRILEGVFDTAPVPAETPPLAAWHGEPVPSALQLVALGARSQAHQWARLPSLVRRTAAAMTTGRARKAAGSLPAVRPLAAPRTRFSGPITANRVYVNVTFPLDQLKQLQQASGCTVNTVFVALCGGALRRYLQAHDELPADPMTAAMPVSIRHPDEVDRYGNRISYWYISLGTEVEGAAARLAAVDRSVEAAREWNQGDLDLPSDWENFAWVFVHGVMGLLAFAERRTGKVACNATVSNVRGPGRLYFAGAPVVALRSMGPIEGTRGINFTAWSYCGDFAIGIHACREYAPDLRELARCLTEEFDALRAAFPALEAQSAR